MTDHCPGCPFKGCPSCAYQGEPRDAETESAPVSGAVAAGNAKNVNDRTAYFAGICWKKLREIQALAEQIVAGDDAP